MATAAAPLLPKAIEKSETYELLVIYKSMVDTEGAPNPATQLETQLTEAGGTLSHTDKAGRRRLPYPIDKQKDGYVVSVIVTLPVESQAALRRAFKLDDNVLRVNWLKVKPSEIAVIQKGPSQGGPQRSGGQGGNRRSFGDRDRGPRQDRGDRPERGPRPTEAAALADAE